MKINPGTYQAALQGTAELTESSKKGSPQVSARIELVELGQSISWTGSLVGGAVPITVESLRRMGWQGDDLSDLSTVGSKAFEVVIEDDPNDPRYSRVKFIKSAGGAPIIGKPMDDAAKKAFASRMRGQVIAASGGKPSAPAAKPAPARPAAPPPGDARPEGPPRDPDDIPF